MDQSLSAFFGLPGELQNMSTQYVLVLGSDIYLPGPSMPIKKAGDEYQGYQGLTTCKKAYLDGREIFWSSNVFIVQGGPEEDL